MSETVVVPVELLRQAKAELEFAAEWSSEGRPTIDEDLILGLAVAIAAAPSPAEVVGKWGKPLDKPARVGATVFRVGVGADLVVARAQREYEYHLNPPPYDKAVLQAALAKAQCTCEQIPGAGCSNCPTATPSPSALRVAQEAVEILPEPERQIESDLTALTSLDLPPLPPPTFVRTTMDRAPGQESFALDTPLFTADQMRAYRTLAPAALSPQGICLASGTPEWPHNCPCPQHALSPQTDQVAKLQAFKDYVHQRLDAMGVPADPESPHKAAGCRIGGRLDCVEAALAAAMGGQS